MHTLDLSIADISKIEGKASCSISVLDGKVTKVHFAIAEYKRFYTQAIRGKDIVALPQLTARICGTCSNAHLLCALKAVEQAINLIPSPQTRVLRALLNYALILRDHALHLYVFVLPDLFGKDSILDFDDDDSEEHKFLDDAFLIKAAGNNLAKAVGGRSVHAPFLTVGGFTKLPLPEQLHFSRKELLAVRPLVLDLIAFFATHDAHLIRDDLTFVSLVGDNYSFLDGEIVTSEGSLGSSERYGEFLEQVVRPYSQASGYRFGGKMQMVGALARMNLGKEGLHPATKKSVGQYFHLFPSQDIFHNNLAQAIEMLHAIDSSVAILEGLSIVDEKPLVAERKAGVGIGVIEAPRGTLFYHLEIDERGMVQAGKIVVPTGQNQIGIEGSIRKFLEDNVDKLSDKERIERDVERIVRAYDPCMSCAAHFLKFRWS